jgi:hypothetical protein
MTGFVTGAAAAQRVFQCNDSCLTPRDPMMRLTPMLALATALALGLGFGLTAPDPMQGVDPGLRLAIDKAAQTEKAGGDLRPVRQSS